jgi:ribosomal protein L12E/L44/L45/RPP1/RPP2
MKHIAAVLLLALAKKEINEKNINEILGSVGIKSNPNVVKAVLNAVKGKTPEQVYIA